MKWITGFTFSLMGLCLVTQHKGLAEIIIMGCSWFLIYDFMDVVSKQYQILIKKYENDEREYISNLILYRKAIPDYILFTAFISALYIYYDNLLECVKRFI